jgi:hypothetical protein
MDENEDPLKAVLRGTRGDRRAAGCHLRPTVRASGFHGPRDAVLISPKKRTGRDRIESAQLIA